MSLLSARGREPAKSATRPLARTSPAGGVRFRPKSLTRARRLQPLRPDRDRNQHARTALAVSVLVSVTLMTVDAAGGSDSPVEPLRTGAAEVFGPLESGLDAAASPVVGLVSGLTHTRRLQADNERLTEDNAALRAELAIGTADRNRLAEYDGLAAVTDGTGFELLPARVIAIGPAQAFRRTVTIGAGRADGVRPDLTVVSGGGLVGRVLSVSRHAATVLLAIDAGSVIGGRLDSSMELGFLRGNGSLGADGRLTLNLVDPDAVPAKGDTIVTWGSRGGSPYVPGVPVGSVRQVQASAGDQSVTATVRPFVDMSALDLVGVVTGERSGGSSRPRLGSGS